MNNNLTVSFVHMILIVLHLMSKIMGFSQLRVLVSSICGHTMDNTNPQKVAGIFQSAVIHRELHLTPCSMEGRSNGSAQIPKRML